MPPIFRLPRAWLTPKRRAASASAETPHRRAFARMTGPSDSRQSQAFGDLRRATRSHARTKKTSNCSTAGIRGEVPDPVVTLQSCLGSRLSRPPAHAPVKRSFPAKATKTVLLLLHLHDLGGLRADHARSDPSSRDRPSNPPADATTGYEAIASGTSPRGSSTGGGVGQSKAWGFPSPDSRLRRPLPLCAAPRLVYSPSTRRRESWLECADRGCPLERVNGWDEYEEGASAPSAQEVESGTRRVADLADPLSGRRDGGPALRFGGPRLAHRIPAATARHHYGHSPRPVAVRERDRLNDRRLGRVLPTVDRLSTADCGLGSYSRTQVRLQPSFVRRGRSIGPQSQRSPERPDRVRGSDDRQQLAEPLWG